MHHRGWESHGLHFQMNRSGSRRGGTDDLAAGWCRDRSSRVVGSGMAEQLLYQYVNVAEGSDWERDSVVSTVAPPRLPHGHGDLWLGPGLRAQSSGGASPRLRPPSRRQHRLAQCPSRHRERPDCYLSQTIHLITSPALRSRNGRRNCRKVEHESERELEKAQLLWDSRRLDLYYFRRDWGGYDREVLEYGSGTDLVDCP